MLRTDTGSPVIPCKRRSLRANRLDGETIVYDPAHHAVHYLNATASVIWDCCDGRNDSAQITETVARTFEIPRADRGLNAQLREDVKSSLRSMLDNGLIDWIDRGTG